MSFIITGQEATHLGVGEWLFVNHPHVDPFWEMYGNTSIWGSNATLGLSILQMNANAERPNNTTKPTLQNLRAPNFEMIAPLFL